MKYAPLIWAALLRKPVETLLTALSIAAAFTLFGLMVRIDATTRRVIDLSPMDRLWVNARFFGYPDRGLPIGMREQLLRIEGVSGVGAFRRLNGYHVSPHNSVGIMTMDEGMRVAWSEGPLSSAQWDELFANPSGLVISRRAALWWKLKRGDVFTLITEPGLRADGGTSWDFTVLGVVEDLPEWSHPEKGFLLGNFRLIENALPESRRGRTDLFFVAVKDASRAIEISRSIDAHFASSGTPTESLPKQINTRAEIERGIDTAMLTWSIAGSGLLMIFFLTGTAISRSVRERVPEFAVLESLGFSNSHVMLLVFVEVAIPCFAGAILGTGAAALLATTSQDLLAQNYWVSTNMLPWREILPWSLAFAALLAIASSALPLSRLRRMTITDALAGR